MGTGLTIAPHKQRHYGRWVLAFVIIASVIVSSWYIYRWYTTGMTPPIPIPVAKADPSIDESPISEALTEKHEVGKTEPRYLSIDSLNVSKSRVLGGGLNDHNMLEAPRNINDVMWYKKSVTPGNEYGAILVSGHGKGNEQDGVFAKLNTLSEGDTIMIERGDGKLYRYNVVESKTISIDEMAATGLKTMLESIEPGKEGLNLVATAGKWVPSMGQFDQRVLVRTILAE